MHSSSHTDGYFIPLPQSYVPGLLRIIQLLSLAAALGSGIMTSRSIYDKAVEAGVADTIGIVSGLVCAVIAGLLVGGGQMLLFTVTVHAHKSQSRQIWGLTAVLLVFTLCISSLSNLVGNAGAASLIYAQRDKTLEYIAFVEKVTANTANASAAADTLAPLENSICGLADQELSNGILSKSAGRGAISAAYSSSCLSVRTIVKTLRDAAAKSDGRNAEMAALLENLDEIPQEVSTTVFDRQFRFRKEAARLRLLTSDAGNAKISQTLEAQLEVMTNSVAALDVKQGKFGELQSAAVQGLKDGLIQVQESVGALTQGAALTPEPPADLPDMNAAIFLYAGRNIQNICISIFVDGFSVFLVLLLGVARRSVELRRS